MDTHKTTWFTIEQIINYKQREYTMILRESDRAIIIIFDSNNHQYYQVKSSKIPLLGLIGFQSQVSSNI